MPEGEEKEQKTENLLEKMKENFLNLAKVIDKQVQEAQRDPKRWMQRGPLQDTSHFKCQRLKIKRES